MKKDIRILFTDLDGTLLNDQKEITPETQKAIDQALAAGHKIVVTTGRPLASGLTCAEKAGLVKEGCYVIAFNGGQIYDPFHKKTIYGKTIPKEIARDIFREAVKRNLYIQSYSDTHVLTLKEGAGTDSLCRRYRAALSGCKDCRRSGAPGSLQNPCHQPG